MANYLGKKSVKRYDTFVKPLRFATPEDLKKEIDAYFDKCEKENRPMTYAGLAYALDIDRQTLYNYAKRDAYFDTIKRARDRVQAYVEEQIITRGNAGTIFYAKNYGYNDRQEVDVNHSNFSDVLNDFVRKL